MKTTGVLAPGDWIFCRDESENLVHAWKLSDAINRSFSREVEERDALFAVVLIPSAQQIYEDAFQSILNQAGDFAEHFDWGYPDERLGNLCRKAGIPWLSMAAEFRAAAPSASMAAREEWLFLGGNGHFNEQGSRLAARLVHRFLTKGDPEQLAGRPLVSRVH